MLLCFKMPGWLNGTLENRDLLTGGDSMAKSEFLVKLGDNTGCKTDNKG